MIRSMTGFGDASSHVEGVHYAVEIRSLNNRYFKPTIRLPEEIQCLEAEIESRLRERLVRGSITACVKMRIPSDLAAHDIDEPTLLKYLKHLETIHQRFAEQDKAMNIDLTALLGMPGVLRPALEQGEWGQRARPNIMGLLDAACDKLMAMRRSEGQTIRNDFDAQRVLISERLSLVAQRAPRVVEEYHLRLKTRVMELLKRAELSVSEPDLLKEVAVFAERSDICEEVSRLAAHLEQFKKLTHAQAPASVGRTLDFLSQEMLREANTIASKSNDAEIARAIVEVKGAIDRIKEQAQNVE